MPIRWAEVNSKLTPTRYTIRNAIKRMNRVGDPAIEVLDADVDLLAVLEAQTQA